MRNSSGNATPPVKRELQDGHHCPPPNTLPVPRRGIYQNISREPVTELFPVNLFIGCCAIRRRRTCGIRKGTHMYSSKLLRFILLFLAASFLAATMAAADSGQDGKLLYRTNCKVCHDKGSPNGQYSPMTLTQDQWRKFFSTKLIPAHKTAIEPKSGKKMLEESEPGSTQGHSALLHRSCGGLRTTGYLRVDRTTD